VSVVCVCSHCSILISGNIIKEMSGSVASGTHCTFVSQNSICVIQIFTFLKLQHTAVGKTTRNKFVKREIRDCVLLGCLCR